MSLIRSRESIPVAISGLLIAASSLFAAPASAVVPDYRQQLPIVAGTVLQMAQNKDCTAGLVLKDNTFSGSLTPYRRAVRFVLTAGHCGDLKSSVQVAGTYIGEVSWKSSKMDLAMIRVEPKYQRSTYCSAPSTGINCSIIETYEPRALGRALLPSLRQRAVVPVEVTGTGPHAQDEVFCTSGKSTGASCSWTAQPIPPIVDHRAAELGAQSSNTLAEPGDSGGPVVSTSGVIHGIISRAVLRIDLLLYVSITQFFNEMPSYAVAPA